MGSGGREHALAWAISRSPQLERAARRARQSGHRSACKLPSGARRRPGLARAARAASSASTSWSSARRRRSSRVSRTSYDTAACAVFGPNAAAARIEGSKAFSKELMAAAGVPTARLLAVARPPCVVKADGLAAGKGVWVCHTQAELDAGLRAAEALGQPFHVEELLEGEEVSIFALCDGARAVPLPAAQDYKRIGDGDEGPNTGGMGSYSPVPRLSEAEVADLARHGLRPDRRGARAARIAVPRRALRRRDAHGRRARGCSSTTAVSATRRRSRSCRASRATCSSRSPRAAAGRLGQAPLAAIGECGGDARARCRATTRRAATPAARSRGSRTPRPRARTSSMPGRRCTTAGSSRTAAGSSTSPRSASRSPRRVMPHTPPLRT